jgi:hypothetical protein
MSSIRPCNSTPDRTDQRSRIVFITRGIEPADLRASFVENVSAARI